MTDRRENIACPHARSEIDSPADTSPTTGSQPVAKEGSASASKPSAPR
jgi:hypothetical protein